MQVMRPQAGAAAAAPATQFDEVTNG